MEETFLSCTEKPANRIGFKLFAIKLLSKEFLKSDTQGNMPPRWGFLSFRVVGYNDAVPPELKSGSSAAAGTAALIQQQCSPFLFRGKLENFSNASERS
jgi:hypothetical protein